MMVTAGETLGSSPRTTAHLVAYLRLLDADAARADWQTSCHSMPPQSCDPTQLVYDAPSREHAG
jgi:hypothetical protein